jgi:hypothetical protein
MALRAKYLSDEFLSKLIVELRKALESVSTKLSIAALLGLMLVPVVPDYAASKLTATGTPQASPASPSAPIEVVRAKPVLVPDALLQPDLAPRSAQPNAGSATPEPATAAPAAVRPSHTVARLARKRQQAPARPEEKSGAFGKAAGPADAQTAAKTPGAPDSGSLGKMAASAPQQQASTPLPPPEPKSEHKSDPETDTAMAEPVPDTWSDAEIIAALRDCLKRLAPLGAEVEIAAPMKQEQCGSAAPVLLKRIGTGSSRVEFQPAPMLNCAMVSTLHTWVEKTLQPAAQEVLGSPVTRIRGASGYACRNRYGSPSNSHRLSEHAHANAIDIMGFVTADGRSIDVESKWGPNVRDIRKMQEQAAEEVALARKAEDEAKAAARKADREAADAARLAKRTAKGAKQEQAKADAEKKQQEAERKRAEAEQKEAERVRRSLQTAELSKLGRGIDPKTPNGKAPEPKVANAKGAIPATVKTDAGAKADVSTKITPEMVFLRRLHKGACGPFGTVLGPDANEAHRNHFHFDLAPRKRSAFCE